jgi:hypothetical protein
LRNDLALLEFEIAAAQWLLHRPNVKSGDAQRPGESQHRLEW